MPTKAYIDSREEMEQILRDETLGFLGLSRDGGPTVVPLNFVFLDGGILFRSARTGEKLDILRSNPKACFTVGRRSGAVVRHPQGASCRADHESDMGRGAARMLENVEERKAVLDVFNRRHPPDAQGISRDAASKCLAVEIRVEEMTGRRWGKGKPACWKYRF
jgi:nitroimidazol reductase NimA-like FMN-containing flavoprotein (pyridoxamine 5'-phosphate oxidase superfamily)